MEKFRKLGLNPNIVKVIEEQRFEEPSEIQEKTIPLVLAGKDVIAGAATGSGKTLVFGAGIIEKTEIGMGIQALVLTPTRELAEQVSMAIRMFSRHKPLHIIAVYGGVSINPQIDALERADVVVGTPGRILDHLERGTICLGAVKILVLDEADRMLDMGFIADVEQIVKHCPRDRQTMLFSATISEDISKLAKNFMRNPIEISAETQVDPSKLRQIYYDVPDNMKFSLLVHLLKNENAGLVMVFCNTKRNVDFVAKNLFRSGVKSMAIHGGFSQAKRSSTLSRFHSAETQVLVCTDVAARGLDIPGVSHIYNYDIPKDSKQYIHRIGRTARAGKEGIAVNILASRDHDNFSRVLQENHVKIEEVQMPFVAKVPLIIDRHRQGQGFGFRRSGNQGQRQNWRRR